MRVSDWISDVCSSDLGVALADEAAFLAAVGGEAGGRILAHRDHGLPAAAQVDVVRGGLHHCELGVTDRRAQSRSGLQNWHYLLLRPPPRCSVVEGPDSHRAEGCRKSRSCLPRVPLPNRFWGW